MSDGSALLWIYLLLIIAGIVLLVLWILVPFIMLSMKGVLHRLVEEQQRTNALLESLRRPSAQPPAARPGK